MSAREWLIKKGGYFYRPNKSGYTTSKLEAGRYTKKDAEREAAIEPWHMSAIHESDVPDPAMKLSAGYRILAPGELDAETVEQCAKLIENGYDKPVGKPWRKDGKPSKNDQCPHGRYIYEDCEPCAVIALRSLAGSKDKEGRQ